MRVGDRREPDPRVGIRREEDGVTDTRTMMMSIGSTTTTTITITAMAMREEDIRGGGLVPMRTNVNLNRGPSTSLENKAVGEAPIRPRLDLVDWANPLDDSGHF
jgi:hypothetical protein